MTTTKASKGEVVKANEVRSAVLQDENVQAFLAAANVESERDPLEVQLDMVRRILSAESVEDVFGARSDAVHMRDMLGVPFVVLDVKWNKSDMADGPGFYAVIEGVDEKGEPVAVTSGAVQVMAQLFALQRLSAFPLRVVGRESDRVTASGFKPQWLDAIPVEKPF